MSNIYLRYLLLAFILCSTQSNAQNLELQWAHAITGDDLTQGTKIIADKEGNIYTAGNFEGTPDFDFGPGTANLTTGTGSGSGNYYFAKYDSSGNYIFAYQFGNGGDVTINQIIQDHNGDIYITGAFLDTVDFDHTTGVSNVISNGGKDIFITKLDEDGNLLYTFSIGGIGTDNIGAITFDDDNNIYITGTFRDTVDFDPGAGTHYLYNPGGNVLAYVAKYTTTGDLVYALNYTTYSIGSSLAIDTAGNLFVGGDAGSIDLDPGAGIDSFTLTGAFGFLAKFDANGNYIKGFAYDYSDINGIAFDSENNLYTLGRLNDSLDVDPGPGVSMIYALNPDMYDLYFVKYDADLNLVKSYITSGQRHYWENGFTINQSDDIYFFGRIRDTIDFDPSNPGGELNFNGYIDGWITKLDNDFNFLDTKMFGSDDGTDEPMGMALSGGNVWMTGSFRDTVDFDLESGVTNLASTVDEYTTFIAKYKDIDAASLAQVAIKTPEIKAYGGDDRVIVDLSALEKTNTRVKVLNLMGQTIADVKHSRNDMLKIDLPGTTEQIYVVVVENDRKVTAKKVWVR